MPNPLADDEDTRIDGVADLRRILKARRRVLRALYVLFVVLALGAIIAAAFFGLRSLAAYFLGPTLMAAYLMVDVVLLHRWRSRLSCAWLDGRINLGVLAGALRGLPSYPQATVDALLRTLPILPPLDDRDLTKPERVAIAAFSDWRWSEETSAELLPGCIVGLLSAGIASLLLPSVALNIAAAGILSGLVLAAVLLRFALPAQRRRRLASTLTPVCRSALLDLARSLDWSGTPAARRNHMLRTLQDVRPDVRADCSAYGRRPK